MAYTLADLPPGEGVIGQIVCLVPPAARGDGPAGRGRAGAVRRHLAGRVPEPAVDPHIIGVTAGSAFGGTVLAILLGVGSLLMMASTFFFGLVALGLIYALAALQGADSTLGLICCNHLSAVLRWGWSA